MVASCSMCCASWRRNRLISANNGKGGLNGPPFLLAGWCWTQKAPLGCFPSGALFWIRVLDQALAVWPLRRRATITAAAPPNSSSIGGAGTSVPPVELVLELLPPVEPEVLVEVELLPPVEPEVLVEVELLPPVEPEVLVEVELLPQVEHEVMVEV